MALIHFLRLFMLATLHSTKRLVHTEAHIFVASCPGLKSGKLISLEKVENFADETFGVPQYL
mgnify:CR=1 FL=1